MATTITLQQIREGAAADLGLLIKTTIAAADAIDTTNHTIALPGLVTKFPDAQGLMDAWITADGTNYRRVIRFYPDNGTYMVQLDGNLSGISSTYPADIRIYRLLSPEDWNSSINEEMEALYRQVRIDITLVDGQSDYACDDQVDSEGDLCTWLQARTQIYDLQYNTSYSTNWNQAQAYGGVSYLQDNNSLTIRLVNRPYLLNNSSLVLRARKPYVWRDHLLEADSDTTTCPYKLALAACQLRALRLMFKRYGQAMKANFAQAAAIAERQYVEAINQFVPAMTPTAYVQDEPFNPDLSPFEIVWTW